MSIAAVLKICKPDPDAFWQLIHLTICFGWQPNLFDSTEWAKQLAHFVFCNGITIMSRNIECSYLSISLEPIKKSDDGDLLWTLAISVRHFLPSIRVFFPSTIARSAFCLFWRPQHRNSQHIVVTLSYLVLTKGVRHVSGISADLDIDRTEDTKGLRD